ncbi:MAG: dehydrogenase [Pirellulaceae bacterium]
MQFLIERLTHTRSARVSFLWIGLSLAFVIEARAQESEPLQSNSAKNVAGNPKVAEVMRSFEPRGVQSDGSRPTSPDSALATFRPRKGVDINLVLAEPAISQPLHLCWDSRGRLWVTEYRQYQFPAGLKIVRYDHHLRAIFDKVPEPPPNHVRGADRISVHEDTDGDGVLDSSRTVIDGLNIATSSAVGRGGIWVLNPPYLLFYPDENRDDIPDRSPEVKLWGFGLQDTHAVANNLQWGPDGWLYGTNGSTTTCNVSSQVTRNVAFEGQCIWRYHPGTDQFEIWAEGGGNTFSLDIDSKGHVFCGHNGGNTRGWHMPQGSYSRKNWGKHGPLTNPHAFGFFESMPLEGDTRRFAQAFVIYEGGLFPKADFDGTIIAPNAMQNLVWHSRPLPTGSSFRTTDEPNLLECGDRWFRPVYCGVGPTGEIYIADWYDTRLSHVSPTDDWHKSSGRVYSLRPSGERPKLELGDLQSAPGLQLVELLGHPNRWVRRRASLELGWRRQIASSTSQSSSDEVEIDALLVESVRESGSIEALCSLSMRNALTTELAAEFLTHQSPAIQRWCVRLLGDRNESHQDLTQVARSASEPHLRSQLAATARRVSAEVGLSILTELLRLEDTNDPHLPLMKWWALEEHADNDEAINQFLKQESVWNAPISQRLLLGNLMRRYATSRTQAGYERCSDLLSLAPNAESKDALLAGLDEALQGRVASGLPQALELALREFRQSQGQSEVLLGILDGAPGALDSAVAKLADAKTPVTQRIEIARALSDRKHAAAQPTLLQLAIGGLNASPALQRVALRSLGTYSDPQIGKTLVARFDNSIPNEHDLRATACRTLATRATWTHALLREINEWRLPASEIPADVIQRVRAYSDPAIITSADQAFGKRATIDSKSTKENIAKLKSLLADNTSSQTAGSVGEKIFAEKCGNCHQLFGVGTSLGPALDNYDRLNLDFWLPAIVAPSLEIREGYQSYVALTEDDRVVTGMIVAQDPRSVTLRIADGKKVFLERDELADFRAIPTSLMPEKLLDDLSDEEIRALFEYLMKK